MSFWLWTWKIATDNNFEQNATDLPFDWFLFDQRWVKWVELISSTETFMMAGNAKSSTSARDGFWCIPQTKHRFCLSVAAECRIPRLEPEIHTSIQQQSDSQFSYDSRLSQEKGYKHTSIETSDNNYIVEQQSDYEDSDTVDSSFLNSTAHRTSSNCWITMILANWWIIKKLISRWFIWSEQTTTESNIYFFTADRNVQECAGKGLYL